MQRGPEPQLILLALNSVSNLFLVKCTLDGVHIECKYIETKQKKMLRLEEVSTKNSQGSGCNGNECLLDRLELERK